MNRLAQPHGTMVLRDVAPSPLERAIEGYTMKMDDELGGEIFRASGSASPLLLKVLERGGWVGEVGSEHAPDPVRLMAGAQRRGIRVGLVAQSKSWPDNAIPGEIYGNLVLRETHPAGVANFRSYIHDISDDHYPAPLIAGQGLFELLRPPGKNPDPIVAAKSYDAGTMTVRMYAAAYARSVMGDKEVRGDLVLPLCLRDTISSNEADMRSSKIKDLIRVGLEELEVI